MNKANEILITVKTGRGGQFYNAGHKSIIAINKPIKEYSYESLFFDEEKNTLTDECGSDVDFEFNEDGTGYISEDGEYDTVTVCLLSDFTEDNYPMILATNVFNNRAETLELLGVKNAAIFEAFNLLESVIEQSLSFELADHFITQISEDDYKNSNYTFEDYEEKELNGSFYVMEL
jgi:hypothetical protein